MSEFRSKSHQLTAHPHWSSPSFHLWISVVLCVPFIPVSVHCCPFLHFPALRPALSPPFSIPFPTPALRNSWNLFNLQWLFLPNLSNRLPSPHISAFLHILVSPLILVPAFAAFHWRSPLDELSGRFLPLLSPGTRRFSRTGSPSYPPDSLSVPRAALRPLSPRLLHLRPLPPGFPSPFWSSSLLSTFSIFFLLCLLPRVSL